MSGDSRCEQQRPRETSRAAPFCDFQFSCLSALPGCELLRVDSGRVHPRTASPSPVQKPLLNETTGRWMKSQHMAKIWDQGKRRPKGNEPQQTSSPSDPTPHPTLCLLHPSLPYPLSGKYRSKHTPSPDKTSLL